MPVQQLPPDCTPAPAPSIHEGHRLRSNLWGNLPLPHNPWAGSDPLLMMLVRERVEPAPAAGGSRDKTEIIRQKTEGIEEAYAAYYLSGRDTLVEVLAIRHASPDARRPTREHHLLVGRYLVAHTGDGGPCHQAVVAHLRRLAAPAKPEQSAPVRIPSRH